MKKKTIKLTEVEAVGYLRDYLNDCDSDELARLLGDCFGGECFQDSGRPEIYNFTPNEFYGGIFDDLKGKQ